LLNTIMIVVYSSILVWDHGHKIKNCIVLTCS
jgi:hypothetical protein